MRPPSTNVSLLLRVRDSTDDEAWNEFASIYRPSIVALAMRKGMQSADAEDLAQQVLISVAKAIPDWKHDPNRASFRTWLNRVTQNAVFNSITRASRDRAIGNTKIVASLNEEQVAKQDSDLLTIEIRRQVFKYAANEIQTEFHSDTWKAFWLTAVEGQSVDSVSDELNRNRGSIYAARSRVMKRLKEKVQELQLLESEERNE